VVHFSTGISLQSGKILYFLERGKVQASQECKKLFSEIFRKKIMLNFVKKKLEFFQVV
jgi:hypothetical protein